MNLLLNLIWFILGGFIIVLAYLLGGLDCGRSGVEQSPGSSALPAAQLGPERG